MKTNKLTDRGIQIHVIGCGGIGSWLVPMLVRVVHPESIIYLWDGDTLEDRNLDRQMFPVESIGMNKAVALTAISYETDTSPVPMEEYFCATSVIPGHPDVLLCCADNHTARRAVLEVADELGCLAIIGANEYTEAEAYAYWPAFRGERSDPRIWAPEILTDDTGDPRVPCTGAAAEAAPQLVIANVDAANKMMRLLWYWMREAGGILTDPELRGFAPIRHLATSARQSTLRLSDLSDK